MNRKEKAKLVKALLDKTIPNPICPLVFHNPYTLLIATLLSAQSTDERVNKITPFLFARADTPKKMISLSEKELLSLIRPIGLGPTKAKAILKLSSELLKKYKGKVPKTFKDLENLPGVGHKTASVVLSFGFDIPAFPVDRHIARSAKRWGLSSGNIEKIEKDLKSLFLKKEWKKIHLQILLYARTICKAKGHKNCPVCEALSKNKSF